MAKKLQGQTEEAKGKHVKGRREAPARGTRVKADAGKELVLRGREGEETKPAEGNGSQKRGKKPSDEFTERELQDIIPENRRMLLELRDIDAIEVGAGSDEVPPTQIPGCGMRRPTPTCDDYGQALNGNRRAVEGRRSVDLSPRGKGKG